MNLVHESNFLYVLVGADNDVFMWPVVVDPEVVDDASALSASMFFSPRSM